MSDRAPLIQSLTADVDAVSKGSDGVFTVGPCPFDGTVTGVSFIADATLTGANTNSVTFKLVNKGQSGSGTTAVAEKAFTSGVNATGSDETAIPLSGTASNLVVAKGDVLTLEEIHVGEGLATPAGAIQVKVSRS